MGLDSAGRAATPEESKKRDTPGGTPQHVNPATGKTAAFSDKLPGPDTAGLSDEEFKKLRGANTKLMAALGAGYGAGFGGAVGRSTRPVGAKGMATGALVGGVSGLVGGVAGGAGGTHLRRWLDKKREKTKGKGTKGLQKQLEQLGKKKTSGLLEAVQYRTA